MSLGWVMFSPMRSLTSSYRRQWKLPSTIPWSIMMTSEESRSLYMKHPPMQQDQSWGQPTFKRQVLPILSPNSLWTHKPMNNFHPTEAPISEIFDTMKDLPWVRHLKPIWYDPSLLEAENIAPIMTVRNKGLSIAGPFRSTWKGLSNKISSKSTSSLSRQPPNPDSSTLHRLPSHNI